MVLTMEKMDDLALAAYLGEPSPARTLEEVIFFNQVSKEIAAIRKKGHGFIDLGVNEAPEQNFDTTDMSTGR